jgi:hypothetical protein
MFVGCEVANVPPLRGPAHEKLCAGESRAASVGMTGKIKSFLQGLKPRSRGVVTWGLKPPPPKEKSHLPREMPETASESGGTWTRAAYGEPGGQRGSRPGGGAPI